MKIAYGKNLRAGNWYKITEIDPHDKNPSLKVGDVVMASSELLPGFLDPENHEADGMGTQWFADYGAEVGDDGAYRTLVNGLEFVRGPDTKEEA